MEIEILLRKANKVYFEAAKVVHSNARFVATLARNLENLNLRLSRELFEAMAMLPEAQIVEIGAEVVRVTRERVGAHVPYDPMYPGFPKQVMEMSQFELYFNALMHYWTHGRPEHLYPVEDVPDAEFPAEDAITLEWGSRAELVRAFNQLQATNTSLPEEDQKYLRWFTTQGYVVQPDTIRQKEIAAIVAAGLVERIIELRKEPLSTPSFVESVGDGILLGKLVDTPTDVLRVMVARSGGDVSLATPSKLGRFPKWERRLYLAMLNEMGESDDLARRPEVWKRIGEVLHPGKYADRYPVAADMFSKVRNDKLISWTGELEKRLSGSLDDAVQMLKQRPGVFARSLDRLLRSTNDDRVRHGFVEEFLVAAEEVPTPILMTLRTYYTYRNKPTSLRAFLPKRGGLHVEPPLEPLDHMVCQAIVEGVEHVLIERFADLPGLGTVWLDPLLVLHPIPRARRNSSRTYRTLARGARIPLAAGKRIRLFVWWTNMVAPSSLWDRRVDIDLSAALFDSEWKRLRDISYYNLKDYGGVHSGDIVDAPEGACEFIELDLDALRRSGARYIAMGIKSFTNQPFAQLPECFAGWMTLDDSPTVFDPRLVEQKLDLTTESTAAVPMYIDLNGWIIWADLAVKGRATGPNNMVRLSDTVALLGKAITQIPVPTLHDLFTLHTLARGQFASPGERPSLAVTTGKTDADRVITPFDADTILSEFYV